MSDDKKKIPDAVQDAGMPEESAAFEEGRPYGYIDFDAEEENIDVDDLIHIMSNEDAGMPVIPLRGITLYPSMLLHFDVGREKSVNALESAMASMLYKIGMLQDAGQISVSRPSSHAQAFRDALKRSSGTQAPAVQEQGVAAPAAPATAEAQS